MDPSGEVFPFGEFLQGVDQFGSSSLDAGRLDRYQGAKSSEVLVQDTPENFNEMAPEISFSAISFSYILLHLACSGKDRQISTATAS